MAEKASDLKPYGLDRPEAKWTLSMGDKEVLVILIGRKMPDGRVYAKAEKGDLIGLLTPELSARVLGEYRKRKVWEGVDTLETDAVEIIRGSGKLRFEKQGPFWSDPAKPEDHFDIRVVNELLGTLAGLKAERYAVDKDASLILFGLEKPEVAFTVFQRDGTKRTLEIGGPVGGSGGKQVYARVTDPGRTDVFVLSEPDTARLLRDRAEYLEKKKD